MAGSPHLSLSLVVWIYRTIGCLLGIEAACLLDHSTNIVMVVIGYVTLVPILLCLWAAHVDRRNASTDELTRLL